MKLKTINPATEKTISEYEMTSKDELGFMVEKSRYVFNEWRKNINTRIEQIHFLTETLRKNKKNLAEIATKEMGKPIKESLAEVEKCAWALEYFADNGSIFLTDESLNTDARKSIVTFEPIGIIASIMPWNFPYWQALRFAAPSLIAGNTIILKPASSTIQCGIEIEEIFRKAGFDDGVFQTVVGNSSIAEELIDSDVNAVTFTGSVNAGAKVAQRSTSQLKKCVLELGGSDPFIVCSDADIEKASSGAVKGRFINSGQSCIASKRFFVVKDIAKEFIEKFVKKTEELRVGDPTSEETDIGPLVNLDGLERIEGLVEDAKKNGAEVLTGGIRLKNDGYFYSPTILSKITTKMKVSSEETFGPVAPITVVDNENEAVTMANDSKFGLGASIWTQDLVKAERLSKVIESGIVSINNVVISDPRVPFGGIKHSGFGRELSRFGMLEFVNIKSVRFYDQLIRHHFVE